MDRQSITELNVTEFIVLFASVRCSSAGIELMLRLGGVSDARFGGLARVWQKQGPITLRYPDHTVTGMLSEATQHPGGEVTIGCFIREQRGA